MSSQSECGEATSRFACALSPRSHVTMVGHVFQAGELSRAFGERRDRSQGERATPPSRHRSWRDGQTGVARTEVPAPAHGRAPPPRDRRSPRGRRPGSCERMDRGWRVHELVELLPDAHEPLPAVPSGPPASPTSSTSPCGEGRPLLAIAAQEQCRKGRRSGSPPVRRSIPLLHLPRVAAPKSPRVAQQQALHGPPHDTAAALLLAFGGELLGCHARAHQLAYLCRARGRSISPIWRVTVTGIVP